eukprot:UN04262
MHIEDEYKEDVNIGSDTGDGGSNSDEDVLNTGHVTLGGDMEIVDDYKQDIYIGDGSERSEDEEVVHINGNTITGGNGQQVQLGFGDDDESDNDVLIYTGHVTMGAPPVTNVPDEDDDDSDNIYIVGSHVTLGGPDMHSSEDDENVPPPPLPPTELYIQENDSDAEDDDGDVLDGITSVTLR